MTALLDVEGLSVTFGGLHAVADLDLTVEEGTLVGLIGPNGAGKTTFIDALTGFVPSRGTRRRSTGPTSPAPDPTSGRAAASAAPGSRWSCSTTSPSGRTCRSAAEGQSLGGFLADFVLPARRHDQSGVDFALDAVGLAGLADRMPGEVSQGQRKLVGVARALAARPRLVCMDEPAAGLDSSESRHLGGQLRRLVDGGTTVLLVDHDMGLVLDVCDRVYVIEYGRRIAEGRRPRSPATPRVIEAYLGTTAEVRP